MKIEAAEAKQQRIEDSNYTCEVCGKRFGQSSLQLAHIVAKHVNYIKEWGTKVIHHDDNIKLTCADCNSSVMIDPNSIPGLHHIALIENKLYNNKQS
jgi:5-methylcytosine-specific restriction endonuclease McrA